jgi:hypothetical protein
VNGLGWASDGVGSAIALVVYGLLLLVLVLVRTARRDPAVMRFVTLGMAWHLIGYLFIVLWLMPYYNERDELDAYVYHHDAIKYASMIRAGDWEAIPLNLGTEATSLLTAVLYLPFGANVYGAVFFSSVLGFIAAVYFCRALYPWCAPAEFRKYCCIAILLPSIVTWSSILGKDSWIALGLGLSAFGFSSAVRQRASRPLLHMLAGGAILTVTRPHIGLSCALAMAFAYCWGIARSMRASILAKLVRGTVLLTTLVLVALIARDFLKVDEVSSERVDSISNRVYANNNIGGSAIGGDSERLEGGTWRAVPRGILRELLEPFPWDVHNFNAGLASAENLFIAAFFVRYGRRPRAIWRAIVRQPYLLFCFVFATELLLMFSVLPNLGLISRQRVQLLPFLFAVLVAAETGLGRSRGSLAAPRRGRSLAHRIFPPGSVAGAA